MEKILNEILVKISGMDEKFNTIDKKISTMDDRIGAMDEKISIMDNRISSMDEKISTMDDSINTIDNKIDKLDTELVEVKQDVKELKRQQDVICNQTCILTEFKTVFEDALENQDLIIGDLETIKREQNRLNASFASVNELLGEHEVHFRTLKRKKIL